MRMVPRNRRARREAELTLPVGQVGAIRHSDGSSPYFRHPDESRGPDFEDAHWLQVWVPDFRRDDEGGKCFAE